MARYEVVARANVGRQLSVTESIEMALKAHALDKGMRSRNPRPNPPHLRAALDVPRES